MRALSSVLAFVLFAASAGCATSIAVATDELADATMTDAAIDSPKVDASDEDITVEDRADAPPDRPDTGPQCPPPQMFINGRCTMIERFSTTNALRRPVDILWAVDTSGSMSAETAAVNANLNRFATIMASSGLDYRVVMVARRGTGSLRVCVPPPLGGASCADSARFRHIDQSVGSFDALSRLLSTAPLWSPFLRNDSARFFVVVTDDESSMTADNFDRQVRALAGFATYTFNSIVGYETRTDCPTMANRGTQYLTLTERTGGERKRVCDSDWSDTFASFARVIVSRVTSWTLTLPVDVETLEVWFTPPGGAEVRLDAGWTYDPATRRLSLDPSVPATLGATVRVVYVPRGA
jgi:hypothetical protein